MRHLLVLCCVIFLSGCLGGLRDQGARQPPPAVAMAPVAPAPAGKRIRFEGGGYVLPDGTRVASDGSGGFTLPNGQYVAPDGAGGVSLPNGTRCTSDGARGYLCP